MVAKMVMESRIGFYSAQVAPVVAGGLGEPIVVGLSLNDSDMILRGAIPAAMLAILAEFFFAAVQKRVSRGYQ